MKRKDTEPKASDFYDEQDPRGMSTSEYDEWMSAQNKHKQKQALIEMMQKDQESGLYEESEFCHYSGLPSPQAYVDCEEVTVNVFIEHFLFRNGFTKRETNVYANKKCTIKVTKDGYEIQQSHPDLGEVSMYIDSHSIRHLVGALTWDDLIDRNYVK